MKIEELLEEMDCDNLDSNFENKVAKLIANATDEDVEEILNCFLFSDRYQTRMMGLRLVKRCLKDKKLFRTVIKRCFEIERLTELQQWYSAILSRYPISSFVDELKNELERRKSLPFYDRNFRALQLHLANYGDKGRNVLDEVQEAMPKM